MKRPNRLVLLPLYAGQKPLLAKRATQPPRAVDRGKQEE